MKLSEEMREDICGTAAIYVEKVAQLEEENEKLLGRWQETKHRCPQCGCGNPIVKHLEDAYKGVCEENDALQAKLAAIECGDCGLTMLECACDEVE